MKDFKKPPNQSIESFQEQQLSIKFLKSAIDQYINIFDAGGKFIQSCIVHGSAGSGKSFVVLLSLVYAIAKGLNVMTAAVMARRAKAIGGLHIHQLMLLQTNHLPPQRLAELRVKHLLKSPTKLICLQKLHVLFIDEASQVSAELLAFIDIVL